MTHYSRQPQKITHLISESFKYYWPVLKAIFPLILLFVLVKDLYIYLGGLPANNILRMIVIFVMLLLQLYLWSAALFSADAILKGSRSGLNKTCRTICQKITTIYLGFFALVLIFCAIFFIGYLLSNWIVYFATSKVLARNLSIVVLVGLPLTYCLVLFFFMIPLLIVESMGLTQAFRQSVALVGYKNWLKTFLIYAINVILVFIVSPATQHGQWLVQHYLLFVFDVIVLSLALPWILNLTLFLLNDLRLRAR